MEGAKEYYGDSALSQSLAGAGAVPAVSVFGDDALCCCSLATALHLQRGDVCYAAAQSCDHSQRLTNACMHQWALSPHV